MGIEPYGDISHKLRSPLSIVKEAINLLLDEIPGKLNEKQVELLQSAKRNADKLAANIDELEKILEGK